MYPYTRFINYILIIANDGFVNILTLICNYRIFVGIHQCLHKLKKKYYLLKLTKSKPIYATIDTKL